MSKALQALRLFICLTVAAFLFCPILLAQGEPDDVVRVETDLVVLNVTVTGADGKYIHGLKREDFHLFENDREQGVDTLVSFGKEETPFAAAILLDTSGSMDTRMSLARAAAIRFLQGLRGEDVAAVYKFDSKIKLMQEFSPSRDLAPLIFDLKADGQTALYDAIVASATDLNERIEPRRAVIVLSDGMDTYSKASLDKALEIALAQNVVIYTVNMADTNNPQMRMAQNDGALKRLAERTGGRYVATPGGQKMREAFIQIAEELSNQYTLAYRPADRTRDGKWRALDLKINRPEAQARTRKGYRLKKS